MPVDLSSVLDIELGPFDQILEGDRALTSVRIGRVYDPPLGDALVALDLTVVDLRARRTGCGVRLPVPSGSTTITAMSVHHRDAPSELRMMFLL